MTDLSNEPEMYKLVEPQTANSELTINQVKKYCKHLNKNLINVMDRLDDILLYETFNENDRKFIQKKDINFNSIKLKKEDIEKHGEIIMSNIFEASLSDAIDRAIAFFESPNNDDWYRILLKYKTEILKLEQDTDLLLDTLNILFDTLQSIYSGLEFSKIEQIKKDHNYIKFDEFDGINFNFGFFSLNISNETDIINRKNLILEAITERVCIA